MKHNFVQLCFLANRAYPRSALGSGFFKLLQPYSIFTTVVLLLVLVMREQSRLDVMFNDVREKENSKWWTFLISWQWRFLGSSQKPRKRETCESPNSSTIQEKLEEKRLTSHRGKFWRLANSKSDFFERRWRDGEGRVKKRGQEKWRGAGKKEKVEGKECGRIRSRGKAFLSQCTTGGRGVRAPAKCRRDGIHFVFRFV